MFDLDERGDGREPVTRFGTKLRTQDFKKDKEKDTDRRTEKSEIEMPIVLLLDVQ